MAGRTFGRWTVLSERDEKATVLCRCECGKEKRVAGGSLRKGESRSCGCLANELTRERSVRHGGRHTPEYAAWKNMRERCYLETHKSFSDYGGRGIRVCDAWREDFAAFLRDVGPRPSPEHSIDRIDNDGNYEPGNVRWATRSTQQRNRRGRPLLELDGLTKTPIEWAEQYGIPHTTLTSRLRAGLSLREALAKPWRAA